VTKGREKQVPSGAANAGAEKGQASRYRAQATIGETVATTRMAGSKFVVVPGFQSTVLSSGSTALPVSDLDILVVYALTDTLGQRITPQTWQRDNDPFFVWEPPPGGTGVAGYSVAIDETPDDVLDTVGTSFNVATRAQGPLGDGLHTFRVKAVNTAGSVGGVASVEVWVDTTPPEIQSYAPQPGTVLSAMSAPGVTLTVTDASSGVAASTISLLLNGSSVGLTPGSAGMWSSAPGVWGEGVNRLELRVSDAVGNVQAPLLWSVTRDSQPPTGSLVINGGATVTSSIYVTVGLEAQDATSPVTRMLLSNDETFGYVEEPFAAIRSLWRLTPVRGRRTVYVKFMDQAGNLSTPVSGAIDLMLLAPETVITSGPAGVTPLRAAAFAFMCPEGSCLFSFAFDYDAWSPWNTNAVADTTNLPFGNHYFRIKAALDVNGVEGIQSDEEDPSPAERTWIVGLDAPITPVPTGPPIKLWRLD
jgi:hypothetical protein